MFKSWLERPRFATQLLLGLCLIGFAVLVSRNGSVPWGLVGPSVRSEFAVDAGAAARDLVELQPWRLLSAGVVHLSVPHLAMSLYALQILGGTVEERCGSPRVVLCFCICGAVGFVASRIWYGPMGPVSAGAGGAIWGMLALELCQWVARRQVKPRDALVQHLVAALALVFVTPVNNPAHFGGFAAGLALHAYFVHATPRPRFERWVAGALVVSVPLSLFLSTAIFPTPM